MAVVECACVPCLMLFVCSSGSVNEEESNDAGAESERVEEGSDAAAESRWLLLNVHVYRV